MLKLGQNIAIVFYPLNLSSCYQHQIVRCVVRYCLYIVSVLSNLAYQTQLLVKPRIDESEDIDKII